MTVDLLNLPHALAWPLAAVLAWVAGELGHRWTGLPRVSLYGLTGFVLGHQQLGLLPDSHQALLMLMANVAFGLVLFEFGYRINLRWLLTNRWLALTGVLEALATLVAVSLLARAWGLPLLNSLIIGSLAMATSPAALLRVINEQRSSGQVTERSLHLSAINCVMAVVSFKIVLGLETYDRLGDLLPALWNSGVVLAVSVALGVVFGAAVPALLRLTGRLSQDATVAFALGVLLLVSLAHSFGFSPILAALTFGLVARHRRVALTSTQRNFGALGDLLTVLLFMFVASTLAWQQVWAGLGLGLALIAVRGLVKVLVVTALARPAGLSLRKGLLTGLAMTPISVFVILLLEQSRVLGVDILAQAAPLVAATWLLELLGPVVAQRALALAGEASDDNRSHTHAA